MRGVVFFDNEREVGETSLEVAPGWRYSELGVSAPAADLDRRPSLAGRFFDEERAESFRSERGAALASIEASCFSAKDSGR